MLARLKTLLTEQRPVEPEDPIEVQVAALLIELARADCDFEQSERDVITRLLRRDGQLDDQELAALIDQAEKTVEDAVSLHPMTRRIHAEYTPEQKRALLLQLWEVALADGHLDAHEEHLISKLADLLYVSRSVFTQTRAEARKQHGLEP